MTEIEQLKNKLLTLKEKYKNKCKALKKANEKIERLVLRADEHARWHKIRKLEVMMLRDLTSHLDKFMYKVVFQWDNEIYTEYNLESFGSRWIKESLLIHLRETKDLLIYGYQIEIISVEKLW